MSFYSRDFDIINMNEMKKTKQQQNKQQKECKLLKRFYSCNLCNGWIERIKSNIDCTHFSGFLYIFFFIFILCMANIVWSMQQKCKKKTTTQQ